MMLLSLVLFSFSLRGLEVPEVVEEESPSASSSQQYTPPIITELVGLTGSVMPLFKTLGYR